MVTEWREYYDRRSCCANWARADFATISDRSGSADERLPLFANRASAACHSPFGELVDDADADGHL